MLFITIVICCVDEVEAVVLLTQEANLVGMIRRAEEDNIGEDEGVNKLAKGATSDQRKKSPNV